MAVLPGINGAEWMKVLYGLVLSTVLGFALGYFCAKLTALLFRRCERRKADTFFGYAQIAGGAAMAFMHGAQDGQSLWAYSCWGYFSRRATSGVTRSTFPSG